MGEIDVLAELCKDNPAHRVVDLQIYADALTVYFEASANIRGHGAISAHPRTGAPIENPYLKVQTAKGAVLGKMQNVDGDRVLRLLQEQQ